MNYKKYSKENNISFSFGGFPTYELLKSKSNYVIEIILHEKAQKTEELDNIIKIAKEKKIKISTNGNLIEKLSGKGNVYIMGVFTKYNMNVDNFSNQVLLVNPSDMGNLGTLIRVMLGFGYKNLSIIKPCIDIFDPKVVRASMGAIFNMNIELFESFEEYEKVNQNYKYPFMLQAEETLQSLTTKVTPHTLIFGNEASGLNENFKSIGTPLLIKHTNMIDSLNLSMSVGIALYEFSK
jgi:TrmH family RNA methyltransferase